MTLERPKPPQPTPSSSGPCTTQSKLNVPKKDEPMNSRMSPTTLNVMCSSGEHEELFSNSMLCLENDLDKISITATKSSNSMPSTATTSAATQNSPATSPDSNDDSSVDMDVSYRTGQQTAGFFEGLLGCLRPVWTIIGKAAAAELKHQQDDWEIPFENITDLQWLGSGAQGAVFLGKYRGEEVAVKKVRDVKETDIKDLRKLNHPNIINFKGVCTQAPCYCIVMEYCPYGQLYEVLRDGKEIPPALLLDWAKQIVSGMSYLHTHKMVHRDLKSPNVLVAKNDIVKISDFGTCREWSEKSTKMSFAGTVAWMAPEVIRNEPCSEKVDIWSFGVVLWELLSHEVPYRDVDSSAIIWGVGSNSLHLPVPSTCPDGFKLLMRQCWSPKPRNRPSFRQILMHLEIAQSELLALSNDQFKEEQQIWKDEILEQLEEIKSQGSCMPQLEEELIARRREELRHAQDVREHYERKLERANNLYMELTACMLQLEKRERELMNPDVAPYEGYIGLGLEFDINEDGTQPSPSKMRSRKSRHRRSNSRSNNSLATAIKSPTKEALHNELETKKIELRHVDISQVNATTFKYLGPSTAIREKDTDSDSPIGQVKLRERICEDRNLNDICFGCDGGCSDATCSSKRSSRLSADADVESNTANTPCLSPTQGLDPTRTGSTPCSPCRMQANMHEKDNIPLNDITNEEDTENMNIQNLVEKLTETLNNSDVISPYNSDKELVNSKTNSLNRQIKRSISVSPESPKKVMAGQSPARATRGQTTTEVGRGRQYSSGEEEYPGSDEDERKNRCRQSYGSTFSSEVGLSEEENTSEHSTRDTPDGLLSTYSTENLHLDLTSNLSDGLSDKESVMKRRMRNHLSQSPEHIRQNQLANESSSDSDDCSDITVSSAVHKSRSSERTLENVW
ncbi:unnamed protein product [Owenia fusiformis]|uniref:Mitogen-activated protein kinase kinase kinase n=1 Tax=Owenia fusiformis TaxID=6347 RepID=A0A8J1TS40_OWEFU|nr:unnamed protein product [Owenia fusiformis]